MKYIIALIVLLLASTVAAKISIPCGTSNVHKKATLLKIKGGRSIGPITPHVGVVINNLAAVNLLVFVTFFPEFLFSKLFESNVNNQALLGLRTTAVTIVAFDAILLKLEDKIGKENALKAYTVTTLARTVLFAIAFYEGVLKSPGIFIFALLL